MIDKIKEMLGLNPKVTGEEHLGIQIAVVQGKLHVRLSKKVDVVTFNKIQLTQLLAAIASQAAGVE